MLAQIVRVAVRMSAGVVLGAVPGALYAGLVGAVHLGVHGRWDRVPAFSVGCVLVGGLFGLLAGITWALSGKTAPGRNPGLALEGAGKPDTRKNRLTGRKSLQEIGERSPYHSP